MTDIKPQLQDIETAQKIANKLGRPDAVALVDTVAKALAKVRMEERENAAVICDGYIKLQRKEESQYSRGRDTSSEDWAMACGNAAKQLARFIRSQS